METKLRLSPTNALSTTYKSARETSFTPTMNPVGTASAVNL